MPGSYGRGIVEVNGEPEFVGNPVVLRNSSLILRNVFVKGAISRVPWCVVLAYLPIIVLILSSTYYFIKKKVVTLRTHKERII